MKFVLTVTRNTHHMGLRRGPLQRCILGLIVMGGWSMPMPSPGAEYGSPGVPGGFGGVVTTSEPTAARVGATLLRDGGNAIDAAVAVAFALNVTEPQSSGIGGGGFMMIYLAGEGRTIIVDSRERAPAGADPNMFLGADGAPFPFPLRSTSGLAVGVPGMLRGAELALSRWGTRTLAEVLQPAIRMAARGIRVSRRLADASASPRLDNEPGDPVYDAARAVFRPGGEPLREHDPLIQPDLATTFRLLAGRGADAFYRGAIADAIVAAQQRGRRDAGSDGQARLRGRMTHQDLRSYQPVIRNPVSASYRGYAVLSMPPPSSGGLTVIQVLKLIERFPLGDEDAGYGFGQARTLHVILEALRLAFADRALWMGDEDFVAVPKTGLLHEAYIAERSVLIDPGRRADRVSPGDPRPYDVAGLPSARALAGLREAGEGGINTTHFTVMDAAGNIVCFTNTIESQWGSGQMVPGYGFLLNNELTDFNAKPRANLGAGGFDPGANDVAPNKRPRSSMAPTIIFQGEAPVAAFGSPGGSTIISSVLNVAINLIDHGLPVGEAVDAPRLAQTSANGRPFFEPGFEAAAIHSLQQLGHDLQDDRLRSIGSVQAVVIEQPAGRRYGAADRRRTGGVQSLRAHRDGGG